MINFFIPVGVAVLGSLFIYVKKWQDNQGWEWQKFTTTLIFGIIVGIIAQKTGVTPQQITLDYIGVMTLKYGTVITIIQTLVQIVWKFFKKLKK